MRYQELEAVKWRWQKTWVNEGNVERFISREVAANIKDQHDSCETRNELANPAARITSHKLVLPP
jgi:hypothetical protein